MFSFANPEYLYLLLLIPVLIIVHLLARRIRRRDLKRFGQLEILDKQMPDVSKYKPGIKLALQLVALAMIIIVLARPRAGAKEQTVQVRGIEVMVALDVSNSMNASATDDPKGVSRLQKSKLTLEKLIDKFENDKVGLIVFAGNAYTQLPITSDFTSAKMFLNSINTEMVPTQGTAIGSAIKLAMNSFTGNEKSQKSIIIITDGENHEDDAVEAAREAHKKGVQVNVIGQGSTKGSPIPLAQGGFMKDDGGNVITTFLNEKMAQEIAEAGGGMYVSGNAPDAVGQLDDQLKKLAKADLQKVVYSQHDEQFPVFAWIAMIFLVIDMFVLERKNSWLRKINFFTKEKKMRRNKNIIIAVLSLMLALQPLSVFAQNGNTKQQAVESNRKERNAIRRGNKLYNEKRYAEAETEYKRALQYNPHSDVANYNLASSYIRQGGSSDPKDQNSPMTKAAQLLQNLVKTSNDKNLVSRAYYNMGNMAFNQQNYAESIEMYKNALRRNPNDDQARDNLRLAQKKKQEQDKQNQDQNKDKNKQDKDKQNKDQNKNDNNKDKKDKDKQDQQNQQNKPNQNKPQKQQNGMSENNAEQILKAMQDAEKGTQQKVNAAKAREDQNARRRTGNLW